MKEKMVLLRDRLNDLSRRNRSIRMLKLYDKWTFDISELKKINVNPEEYLRDLLDKKEKTFVKQSHDQEEAMVLSKKLTTLFRNLNAIEEETGLYDLYAGYPFIDGTMTDGTYIRAPLFLYPVRLNKEKKHGVEWKVEPIPDETPQLNRSLFLALQKLSDLHVPELIYEEAEEKAASMDLENLAEWLEGYGMNVEPLLDENIKEVESYRKEDIPVVPKGRFRLQHQAVIGHFPQGNSAILKDYEQFMEKIENEDESLGLVSELLDIGKDQETESVDRLPTAALSSSEDKVSKEKSKFLVLDTDASQEHIIDSLEHEKGIVVHGPPGTGKSQVIVNMIANAVANEQRVMLVTQKRAALDVVYQRLDSLGLSANAALLHDEKNDRNALYRKLNQQLSNEVSYKDLENELESLSARIVQTEEELDNIAQGLYEVQPHGYRAYDLYAIGKPAKEQEEIVELDQVLGELNKDNLNDVLMKIFSYGRYYSRFGAGDYPLKDRKSFGKLEMKDRVKIVELLDRVIQEAENSIGYLDHFEEEDITPAYSWEVDDKIAKIYDDLNEDDKKTLQKLRLWMWTTFTGKTIVEDLLGGDKFRGMSSKEWPKLKQSLSILYELANVSEDMSKNLNEMKDYISEDTIEHYKNRISTGDIPLSIIQRQQNFLKEDFEELREMDRLYDESSKTLQKIIDQLKEKSDPGVDKNVAEHWKEIAEQSTYIYWIDEVERKYPSLSKIGTDDFDHLRKKLKDLLVEKKELSIQMLQNKRKQILLSARSKQPKAIKEITYQTGKKRKIWPVRKLVNEYALHGLLDVMPVWLVSPEVASAIFPLEEEMFDLVIFDEASQCTVENGIPAIYRGKKVVVAGDEKQLPPSSLFKGSVQEDEDEEQEDFEESESLLNLAKRVLPSSLLEWHYRSKSEELINFSNHAYYNGNIQIAPNVNHLQSPSSVQWHKVDGHWVDQRNRVEAEEVVTLLKQKLIEDPSKTIGIITFNSKQQETIESIIERRAEEDKEFGVLYEQVMGRELDERIFVKNIENVQGDERDIIIFSITYAKNQEGRVHNRFGSLNQQGGENRLNVAVTRAKEQVHLVSSIEPYELNVAGSKNDGPKYLKSYMEYAQAVSDLHKEKSESVLQRLNEEMNTKRQNKSLDFDSPFEEEVYNKLVEIGYEVDTQVGMSGYRIDMAIVHPQEKNKYIIGIECDGAMYHSSLSARERDVYRQRFLESKGWTLTRIWSRNWWKDSIAEIERIDQLVQSMVNEEKLKEEMVKQG
ncbi:AAA domain-containing protein [Halobacillus sp. K22]|uniref:AAA domain-containing protein n=1 Tax=Halobacillus sp. K22 TaxID=3457431 RepID=UPI003FCE1560